MDVRAACALAGALVRAAVLAKAPRRTTAAVAAAAFAAAQRGLRSDADASPAAAGDGPLGAAPGGGAAALRAARAAARKRRKAAAKARKQRRMEADDGDAEMDAPPGDGEPLDPPLALEPVQVPVPSLAADELFPLPATSSSPTLPSSSSGAAPVTTEQDGNTRIEELHIFDVGKKVVIVEGAFAGACGCVASVESGRAAIVIPDGGMFHESSPIDVSLSDLVLQRSERPGGAHPGRRRGKQKK